MNVEFKKWHFVGNCKYKAFSYCQAFDIITPLVFLSGLSAMRHGTSTSCWGCLLLRLLRNLRPTPIWATVQPLRRRVVSVTFISVETINCLRDDFFFSHIRTAQVFRKGVVRVTSKWVELGWPRFAQWTIPRVSPRGLQIRGRRTDFMLLIDVI